MAYPNPTTGVGVAAKITVDAANVALSLTGTTTHQIVPILKDAAGSPLAAGTPLVLTAAANASAGTTVYTGTITGGGSNALAGREYVVAGFATGANNGTFACTASSTTTLTLTNTAGVAETHAGTATAEGATGAFTYVSRNPSVATVSASGKLTAVKKGHANVEVCYPVFDNLHGAHLDTTPLEKVYAEIEVFVNA